MSLKFQPKAGSVVFCDYAGFVAPEMIKKRPVIIVSKHRHNSKLVAIVPISTTMPVPLLQYHIEMEADFCIQNLSGKKSWIKCDMFNVVSVERLHMVRDRKTGLRHTPNIGKVLLDRIKESVRRTYRL